MAPSPSPALSPTMKRNARQMAGRRGHRGAQWRCDRQIETDKATMELDDGTTGRTTVPAGTEGVKVNALIMTLFGKVKQPTRLLRPPRWRISAALAAAPVIEAQTIGRPKASPPSRLRPERGLRRRCVRRRRRDGRGNARRRPCFRDGRRGRRTSGPQGHAGAAAEFGPAAIDTPITEQGFAGLRRSRLRQPVRNNLTSTSPCRPSTRSSIRRQRRCSMSGGQMGCPIGSGALNGPVGSWLSIRSATPAGMRIVPG